jgi:putative membrane-bound dehydrogenase-like protein
MKRLSLIVPLILALLCPLFMSAKKNDEVKHIVFIAGNRSHGSGEHEFYAGCMLLAKALNEQSGLNVKATVLHANWPKKDKAILETADTVVIYADGTSGHAGQWEFLDSLAKKGVGMVFMHYAVHPSAQLGKQYYQPWIGGAMESGWSVNPHWVADLSIIKDHELGNGVPDKITCLDEWYYNMRFIDERDKVLDVLTAVPTRKNMNRYINMWNKHGVEGLDKKQTLMWGYERPNKSGRGIGFTGGHYHHTWAIDGTRTAVLNAIVWTAGMKVPEGGVKSKTPTEDEFNANLDDYGKNTKRLKLPNPEDWRKLPPAKVNEKREAGFNQGAGAKGNPAPAPVEKKIATKALYKGPLMKSGDRERLVSIDVPVKGRDLYLVVSDEGDQSHDWANWIEPVVTLKDGSTQDLTAYAWKMASTGHGGIGKGTNCQGKPLTIAGKTFAKGLGVHADSVIHYKVPGGLTRFQARVGLDDGGADRGQGPTPASVRFYLFTEEPSGIAKAGDRFDPGNLAPQMVPLEALEAPEDLEVTVWATSPMLLNPTNMDTDAAGRIWVAEGVNYRRHQKRRPEGDRIVVLEDKDGDGKADSAHTFVQDPELVAPLGISVIDNKIIVAQPPNLIVYTDVNRDLVFDPKVDKRENLLSGFNGKNHDHSLHAVVGGPDGKWYFNHGNTGANFKSKDGKEFWIGGPYKGGGGEWPLDHRGFAGKTSDDGHVWVGGFAGKMNPDGSQVQIIGHGFRNSYEHTVTSFGDVFQNDNDDPPACRTTWLMEGGFLGFFSPDGKRHWKADQRPGQSVPEAHWRQWDPGTLPPGDVYGGGSPTGICFYENGALPVKYEGLLASCDAGRRVVFGYHPELRESNFLLERFDFFKSKAGNMFRPSDVMVGADGAIYVADWFDPGVGGHNDRDQSCSGTIYRIAPRGFKPQIPKASADTIEGAITLLRSPAQNVRFAGFEALKKAGAKALPAVRSLLEHRNKYVQARAVWLLAYLGPEGLKLLNELIESPKPEVRLLAFRALRNAGQDPLLLAPKFIQDPHPAVRRELAVSLRDANPLRKASYVNFLLTRCRASDRTYLEACGLAAEGVEDRVWISLRTVAKATDPLAWSAPFVKVTWRLGPVVAIDSLQKRAESPTLSDPTRLFAIETLAFIDDPKAAQALVEVAKVKGPVGAEAARWLIHLGATRWNEFDVVALLKKEGIYDPAKQKVTEMVVPVFEGTSKLPPLKELLAMKGDAAKGKTVAARCVMCHEVDGQGVNYGPSFRGWIKNQGEEKFLRAVVTPSAEIAHGYSGSIVRLKGGGEVHGLVLSSKNPLIVQSQGGLVQIIPANKVQKVEPLKRSLMLSADQLGLTAQDLADLTAYVKTLK